MQIFGKIVLSVLIASSFLFGQIQFEAESIEGDQIGTGKIAREDVRLLINFWASWCQPCKAEMKHLKNIYEKYKSTGFTIVGINQDSPKSLSKVKSFISSNMINYPIVLDPNNQIFQKYNGQVMPYSILVNPKGEIAFKHTGYLPGDEVKLEEEITKLLSVE
ncbi:MAG: TlpA family protein disulfide reductase [Ignavibacteriales bacterium]|nr:TlpA family protein disulfide reductase [Ignavibacteriales bacterium]